MSLEDDPGGGGSNMFVCAVSVLTAFVRVSIQVLNVAVKFLLSGDSGAYTGFFCFWSQCGQALISRDLVAGPLSLNYNLIQPRGQIFPFSRQLFQFSLGLSRSTCCMSW